MAVAFDSLKTDIDAAEKAVRIAPIGVPRILDAHCARTCAPKAR